MTGVVSAITGVFTEIGEWFVNIVIAMLDIFYVEGSLTFIGTLAVMGLGIAVILMVLAMIRSYIRFQ